MKSRLRPQLPPALLAVLTCTALAACDGGDSRTVEAKAASAPAAAPAAPVADRPIADYQLRLLELAFETASAFPLDPHIKNRSRAQESVVEASFQLDQPKRALAYVEQIDNWRRGAGYADYAFYCAQKGDTSEVERYLKLARSIADDEDVTTSQEWRRDQILSKIARARVWLGQDDEASLLEVDMEASETGRIAAARARLVEADVYAEEADALDGLIATGTLDQVRASLQAYVTLYERFYGDDELRAKTLESIEPALEKVPKLVGFDALVEMAGVALAHEDDECGLELVERAQGIVDAAKWLPEDEIPLVARIVRLRHRAGDGERAREQADAAWELYLSSREKIIDIFRADALIPLAEAFWELGDAEAALEVYERALEEGVINPNSRPRADDLTAICCSMALHEVEPHEALWDRMVEVHDQLDHPW